MKRVRQPDVGEVEMYLVSENPRSNRPGRSEAIFWRVAPGVAGWNFFCGQPGSTTLVDLPLHEVIARMNLALLRAVPRRNRWKSRPKSLVHLAASAGWRFPPSRYLAPLAQPPTRIQPPAPPRPFPLWPSRNQLWRASNGAPAPLRSAPVEPKTPDALTEEPTFNPIFSRTRTQHGCTPSA